MPVSDERLQAGFDVLLVIVVFTALRGLLAAAGVPKPASIAVVVTLLVATLRLRQQHYTWSGLGLAIPDSIPFALIVALSAYSVAALAIYFIVNPIADVLGLAQPAFHKLGELQGNLPYLLFMIIVIGWGAAALGEELLFRGFLLNRLIAVIGGGAAAMAVAIVLQAVLFGLGHLYLGARGAMTAGMIGLVFGIFYPLAGQSLWPLIIAHGITDTIGLYALYAGFGQP